MQCVLSLPYGGHPRQRFDLVMPDGAEDRALVILLHGGWWAGGRHEDLRLACLALAEHGIPCASLGMRPLAGLGDATLGTGAASGQELLAELASAVGTVLEEAALVGMDGCSAAFLGSGSGSLMALLLASQLGEDRRLHIRAAVACGATTGLGSDAVVGAAARAAERFAGTQREALSALLQRPERFPPLLLIHGSQDGEVPLAAVQRFQARQAAAGEPCELQVLEGAGQQLLEQPYERAGQDALRRLVPFLREHLDNPLEPAASAAGPAAGDEDAGDQGAPPSPTAHAH
jgi:acetyl esterase/lipase